MKTQNEAPNHGLAAGAWNSLSGNVLRGLNHSFSNRLTSLGAVAAGLGSEDSTQTLGQRVEGEIDRMEELLRLYRVLPFVGSHAAEPSQLSEAVSAAVALFEHHYGLRDVPCRVEGDPATPPVLYHSTAMVQTLLLLLSAAGRHLNPEEASAGVVLRYAGDADMVNITAETAGPAAMLAEWPEEIHGVRWLARDAASDVQVEPTPHGGVRVRLRVGSLAFLRRRERAG